MTTYSTQNPLGSADPRDLYDNAENLDEAVNDLNSETWIDRFGVERITIQGALNRFNEIIISGGQIFESEEAGRDAVQDGQYYYSVSDDPDVSKVLWRRVDADNSEFIADDPSAEFVERVAGSVDTLYQSNMQTLSDFHDAPIADDSVVYSITDKRGGAFMQLRHDGLIKNPWKDDFHDKLEEPFSAFVSESNAIIFRISLTGELILPDSEENKWRADFHDKIEDPFSAFVSESSSKIMRITENGEISIPGMGSDRGGLDLADMPESKSAAIDSEIQPEAFKDYGRISYTYGRDTFIGTRPHNVYLSSTDLYARYDELMSLYPEYISREYLGDDALGNAIYNYTAIPADYHLRWLREDSPAMLDRPRIVLLGGVHGNEKYASFNVFRLFKELCENWKNDERLCAMRWGCEFSIIPIVNPSGFNVGERRNHNDVDLNRNFPEGWENTSGATRGPSPASELETQIVLSFFESELAKGAGAFIDHHNAGGLNRTRAHAYWLATDKESTLPPVIKSLDYMSAFVRRDYGYVDQQNVPLVRLTNEIDGTSTNHVQRGMGGNGYLIETGTGFASNQDRQVHEWEGLITLVNNIFEFEDAKRLEVIV